MSLCAPHFGIGGDGIVLIEKSLKADAKMRSFNRDGSEGKMAGNNIRCVAKYLYDKGYVRSEFMTIETAGGIHHLRLYLRDGKVSSVSVGHGPAILPRPIPVTLEGTGGLNRPAGVGGTGIPRHLRECGEPPLRRLLRRHRRPGPGASRPQV